MKKLMLVFGVVFTFGQVLVASGQSTPSLTSEFLLAVASWQDKTNDEHREAHQQSERANVQNRLEHVEERFIKLEELMLLQNETIGDLRFGLGVLGLLTSLSLAGTVVALLASQK